LIRKSIALPFLAAWLLVQPGPSSEARAQEWAAALFDGKLIHDFGTVARGALVEHRFKLENIYREDIQINSVTASCGCTKLSTTKKLLKMYDTAEIVVELDTRRNIGFKEATIRVALAFQPADPSRSPVPAEVQLKLRAFIRGDVVFEPGAVQFGSISPGQNVQKQVAVTYAGRATWRILEATSSSPNVQVSFKETGRGFDPELRATKVTYDLAVALKDTAPAGYLKERITLKTNDDKKENARVPLVVQGFIVPALSANPSMLILGVLKPGQPVSRNVVVRADKPFRISSVTGPDQQFRFTHATDARPVQLLTVHFTAGNKPGKVSGKIHIVTDLDNASLDVDTDGNILPADAPPGESPKTGVKTAPDATGPSQPGPSRPGPLRLEGGKSTGNVLRSGPLKEVEPAGEKTPPVPKP
jgi:hypothetical protein